jgi:L-rhamnose-H+ transport protein
MTNDLADVLRQQSADTLWWTYFFGAMSGLGGLTFGLTMRYLGMSLGMGVALGYCAAFGTLLPPIFKEISPSIPVPETIAQIAATNPAKITLGGVAVCLLGIGIAALAGLTKEKEMPAEEKKRRLLNSIFPRAFWSRRFPAL